MTFIVATLLGYEMARPAMATVGDRAPSSLPSTAPAASVTGGPVAESNPPSSAWPAQYLTSIIGGELRRLPSNDRWVMQWMPDGIIGIDEPEFATNNRTFTEIGSHGD